MENHFYSATFGRLWNNRKKTSHSYLFFKKRKKKLVSFTTKWHDIFFVIRVGMLDSTLEGEKKCNMNFLFLPQVIVASSILSNDDAMKSRNWSYELCDSVSTNSISTPAIFAFGKNKHEQTFFFKYFYVIGSSQIKKLYWRVETIDRSKLIFKEILSTLWRWYQLLNKEMTFQKIRQDNNRGTISKWRQNFKKKNNFPRQVNKSQKKK